MAVGRDLPDVIASVIGGDGLHPLGLVGGQVLFSQIAAGLSGIAVDGVGNGSPVEGFAVGLSKLLQSFGHALILKDLTGSGSAAVDGEIRCPGLVKFWG